VPRCSLRALAFFLYFLEEVEVLEKVFKTLEEQVDLLKNRGLKVEQSDKKILEIENYYNVINGYKDLFLKKKNLDFYKEGASFKEIYALFEFDRKIRMIFLSKILKIEHNIKSLIEYYFSKQYGHNDYFLFENFRIPSKKVSFSKIEEVINVLKDSISKSIGKDNTITHYSNNHGYVPLWVAINIFTLGNINKFYGILKNSERSKVSKYYNIQPNEFQNLLKNIVFFRNKSAHGLRFYNTKYKKFYLKHDIKTPKKTKIYEFFAIPKNDRGKYIMGRNDLFSLLISLKFFLKYEDFSDLIDSMYKEISFLDNELKTILIKDVLNSMGFPNKWKELKDI
jgi:abortive infection bacteriophage resistance protein